MKNIRCFFGFHRFEKWEYTGKIGKYQEQLKRRCERCGKIEYYEGLTQICIESGEKSPYIYHD